MYNACDKDTLYLLDRSSIEKRNCPQAIAQAGAKLHKANDSEAHSTIMGISGNVKALKHANERGILQKKTASTNSSTKETKQWLVKLITQSIF